MRTLPGYQAIAKGGPIEDVEHARGLDSWSADLTLGEAMIANREGNTDLANILARRFVEIAPHSKLIRGPQ